MWLFLWAPDAVWGSVTDCAGVLQSCMSTQGMRSLPNIHLDGSLSFSYQFTISCMPDAGVMVADPLISQLFSLIYHIVGMIDQLSRILEVVRPQPRKGETRGI